MKQLRIACLDEDLKESLGHLRRRPDRVREGRARVEAVLRDGASYYGINTGFGALAQKRIPPDQIRELQRNLLLSHAVGVGELVPREISRLMLGLKIHSLGLGFSGVSLTTFERLLDLFERDLIPGFRRSFSLAF